MGTIRDFFRFLGRLVRDGVFQAATVYGIVSFLAKSLAQLPGGYSVLFSPGFYGTVWLIGFLIAVYRLDRSLRSQIVKSDIIVTHTWFREHKESEMIRQGIRVIYPQPSGVHPKTIEGWGLVYGVDEHGEKQQYVIGDDAQRIYLVPMMMREGEQKPRPPFIARLLRRR